jgi:hypothetical protein
MIIAKSYQVLASTPLEETIVHSRSLFFSGRLVFSELPVRRMEPSHHCCILRVTRDGSYQTFVEKKKPAIAQAEASCVVYCITSQL